MSIVDNEVVELETIKYYLTTPTLIVDIASDLDQGISVMMLISTH